MSEPNRLAQLDHLHVWHPFTPMKQWRQQPPLVIERGDGEYLIDAEGRRYIDGVSSLWCNVHGHRVPAIDRAIRDQLDKIAHTTLLGLASQPSIELAAMLVDRAPRPPGSAGSPAPPASASSSGTDRTTADRLEKVFYCDAGATALEVAFKMAVGYWYHHGQPQKHKFIGLAGGYHGDTTGTMAVGYSELFHRPFRPMVFPVATFPAPDACRPPPQLAGLQSAGSDDWPSEDPVLGQALNGHCLNELEQILRRQADETAAIVIEPLMQGAAGMICQPPGFVGGVAALARKHNVLLIADEVAVGFGRTGKMFACEHDGVVPDVLCLGKGLSGGYLPLAATLCTNPVEEAFCGESDERRTLYHGHTYTGNALACAAAIASLKLFDSTRLLDQINANADLIGQKLSALHRCPHVLDTRQRGMMVGIELCQDRRTGEPLDGSGRSGAAICQAMRIKGLIVRPLGNVVVLMPIPTMKRPSLERMLDIVVKTILTWDFGG